MIDIPDLRSENLDGARNAQQSRRDLAIRDIADAELLRSTAPYNSQRFGFSGDAQRNFVPGEVVNGVRLFTADESYDNLTLTSFEMKDDWETASDAESEIPYALESLRQSGYRVRYVPRLSAEAETRLSIITDQTGEVNFVGFNRVRTVARATKEAARSDDPRSVVQLKKNSWFAIDMNKLEEQSPAAAQEVNLIIACSTLRSCRFDHEMLALAHENGMLSLPELYAFLHPEQSTEHDWVRLSRALNKIDKAQIPAGVVFERLFDTPHLTRVWSNISVALLESAIDNRASCLAPAATTFYISGTRHAPATSEEWSPPSC